MKKIGDLRNKFKNNPKAQQAKEKGAKIFSDIKKTVFQKRQSDDLSNKKKPILLDGLNSDGNELASNQVKTIQEEGKSINSCNADNILGMDFDSESLVKEDNIQQKKNNDVNMIDLSDYDMKNSEHDVDDEDESLKDTIIQQQQQIEDYEIEIETLKSELKKKNKEQDLLLKKINQSPNVEINETINNNKTNTPSLPPNRPLPPVPKANQSKLSPRSDQEVMNHEDMERKFKKEVELKDRQMEILKQKYEEQSKMDQEKISALTLDVKNLRLENKNLIQEVQNLRASMDESFQQKLNEKDAAMESMKSKIIELEELSTELKSEIETQKELNNELETRSKELYSQNQSLEISKDSLRNEVNECEKKIGKLENRISQIQAMKEVELRSIKEDMEKRLLENHHHHQQAIATMSQDYSEKLRKMEEQHKHFIDDLQRKVTFSDSEVESGKMKSLNKIDDEKKLKEALDEQKSIAETMKLTMENMKQESIDQISHLNEGHKRQIQTLQAQFEQEKNKLLDQLKQERDEHEKISNIRDRNIENLKGELEVLRKKSVQNEKNLESITPKDSGSMIELVEKRDKAFATLELEIGQVLQTMNTQVEIFKGVITDWETAQMHSHLAKSSVVQSTAKKEIDRLYVEKLEIENKNLELILKTGRNHLDFVLSQFNAITQIITSLFSQYQESLKN